MDIQTDYDSTPIWKRCTKCKLKYMASTQYFYKKKTGLHGLTSMCKTCFKKDVAKTNREKYSAYQRRYYKEHRERMRLLQNQKRSRWVATHRDKLRIYSQHRLAKKALVESTFNVIEWQYCLKYFNGRCAYCGSPAGLWTVIAQDHFIPLSKNGDFTSVNIVPACHAKKGSPVGTPACNQSKSNKDAREWVFERFGNRKGSAILDRIDAYFEHIKSLAGGAI